MFERKYPEKDRGKKRVKNLSPGEYAASLLARKAYSVAEVRKKMQEKGYSPCEIEEVVDSFLRKGFLNDGFFAESLCSSLHSSGYGRKRIIAKLRSKGIPSELMQSAFQQEQEKMDPAGMETMEKTDVEKTAAGTALKGKLRTLNNEPDLRKRREKALRFLAGRGFDAEICFQVVDQYLKEEKNSSFY